MEKGPEKLDFKRIIEDCVIVIVIAIVAFSAIFTKPISDLDEIWNYNFARNLANGLVPYKDFNIVTTPLLPMICGMILNIFGNQLIVMRYLAVILMCLIFFFTYKILCELLPKNIALLLMVVFVSLYRNVMCIDYNYSVLFIALILLYIELKNKKDDIFEYSFRYNFAIGLIAGIAVLFKQSVGGAVAIACIGYKIFEIRKKEDIKIFIKIALTRFLGVLIPMICFVIYLLLNNALNDFINYAVLGIKTFSNRQQYTELLKKDNISVLVVLAPIALILMFLMLFTKKVKEEICMIFAYSISMFIVVFPICDEVHFLIGTIIIFIGLAYIIYEYSFKFYSKDLKREYKLFVYGLITFISILFLLIISYKSMEKFKNSYVLINKEETLNHFIGIPENIGLKKRIEEIDDYILEQNGKGKKVYILDAEAALYYIPLDMYNKDYDLFTKGNFGADGEDGLIERIKKEDNAIYLLKKYGLNWQNPDKVREYVLDNLNQTGDISFFMIYE